MPAYPYAQNNPLNFSDPTGLQADEGYAFPQCGDNPSMRYVRGLNFKCRASNGRSVDWHFCAPNDWEHWSKKKQCDFWYQKADDIGRNMGGTCGGDARGTCDDYCKQRPNSCGSGAPPWSSPQPDSPI